MFKLHFLLHLFLSEDVTLCTLHHYMNLTFTFPSCQCPQFCKNGQWCNTYSMTQYLFSSYTLPHILSIWQKPTTLLTLWIATSNKHLDIRELRLCVINTRKYKCFLSNFVGKKATSWERPPILEWLSSVKHKSRCLAKYSGCYFLYNGKIWLSAPFFSTREDWEKSGLLLTILKRTSKWF